LEGKTEKNDLTVTLKELNDQIVSALPEIS
jgi:hypothetical protein